MSAAYAAASTARHVDLSKSESDLAINIRKATSIEETAPKRKHVRACIVYTWDHKSSQSFWAGMKVQPILADEVQTFKALITIHKVLQEGHPIAVREAQPNATWLETLSRGVAGDGLRGYGPLIREYVYFLLAKLSFHRQHPEFNGLFEYEEYISLKTTNDPNEGFETISDLMTLQDLIDTFQKLIFSHFRGATNNECRISALVPLVQESYGIYKFVTSMLRAMHTTTGNDDALEPLRARFDTQYYRLLKFYYECSNLRYLTSLISVPKLPQEPPNLLSEDDERPALPSRPKNEPKEPKNEPAKATPPPPSEPEPINNFWEDSQRRQQQEFDAHQRQLQEQWQQQQLAQQQAAQQAQREFERQQALLAEQQRLENERLAAQQFQEKTSGRLAQLEQENFNARAQYERDQLMLEQYDRRVKDLETQRDQLNDTFRQQIASKDAQISALQDQTNTWRSKYEALAKLYSQLRSEHLDLLQRFKGVQLKAASAQEAIDRREKLEREVKTKNLELADMIRERDRALHDKDRQDGARRDEIDTLKRELRLALDRADSIERDKGSEVSAMLARSNREISDLEDALRQKSRQLDDLQNVQAEHGERDDLERLLRDKEEELEITKSAMDQALQLQPDALRDSLVSLVDSVLQSGVQRIDDAVYELDSFARNVSAGAPFLLSQIEKASTTATEFATAFNDYIADADPLPVIPAATTFAGAIADVLSNTKGLKEDDPTLIATARQSAIASLNFFRALQSSRLEGLEPLQKTDVVINNAHDVQLSLQRLSKLVDAFAPKSTITNKSGKLEDIVDRELAEAASAIDAAADRLTKLKKPREAYSTFPLKVSDSILDAAIALTHAIAQLIKAATASQREIVENGRGSSSATVFYKKNNRWTEGLISAAKAVASSTNLLIETADAVLTSRKSPEHLIVASNEVAASTAQLVAASRVRAQRGSPTQDRLEDASKAVGRACRALVSQVNVSLPKERPDFSSLSSHEFKVREMEQQVEIIKLRNSLDDAVRSLAEMRKMSYQD